MELVLLFLFVWWHRPQVLWAQAAASPPLRPYIDRVIITGNTALKEKELIAEMRTRENTIYFSFFRPWVGLYQFGKIFPDSSSLRNFFQLTLGEAPAEFDSLVFQDDLARLKELYAANGYLSALVEPKLTYLDNGASVRIELQITEGEPTRIQSLKYVGLDELDVATQQELKQESVLQLGAVYNIRDMLRERLRIVAFLQDRGYAFISTDSIRAEVRLSSGNRHADITFFVRLPERLYFGEITAVVHNPVKPDTASDLRRTVSDGIQVDVYSEQYIEPYLIRRSVAYRPMQLSSLSAKRETIRQLGLLGIFESVSIRDDSVREGRLYTTIDLQLLPRHQIKPELRIDNRNNAPNFSPALSYLNRNLFGGAESFTLAVSGGLQPNLGARTQIFAGEEIALDPIVYNFDTRIEYSVPYFFSPRNRLVALLQYSNLQDAPRRQQSVLFRFRSQIFPNDFQQITLDFLEIEFVDIRLPNLTEAQLEDLFNRGVPRTFPRNISNRIDFFFSNLPEVRRTIDARFNTTFEISGALPYLFGAGFGEGEAQILGLRYNQFMRISVLSSIGIPITGNSQLAFKVFAGYLFPYAKSTSTPLERRFYAGGPNSLRGWGFNLLGPGNNPADSALAVSRLGSDIKLEFSLEQRWSLFRTFGYSSGIVIFLDAGNIWARQGENALSLSTFLEQVALNTGLGLRFGTPIGPLRLDFAYRIYDPSLPPAARWQIQKWQLGSFQFNFGIGEAF
ncbi:MAG: BamA/TamA family outer membrane protein [Chloroherpetonaceae bacterium]|nr:BamA/TamA family outer membrane protein [Chloroherpetonaceae bacterium]